MELVDDVRPDGLVGAERRTEEVHDLVERRAEGDEGPEAGELLAGERGSLSADRLRRGGAGRAKRTLEAEPVEGVVGDGRA